MTTSSAHRHSRGRAARRAVASLLLVAVAPLAAPSGGAARADAAADASSAAATTPVPCTPLTPPRQAGPDPRHWVDGCGADFFVEAPRPAGPSGPPVIRRGARRGLTAPLRDTFSLESDPGAERTLYLQFTGATLEDTALNADYALPTITAPPFSITPPVDTRFSARELAEIQRTWQVTAEDFAPFDLNVTTRPPAPDALERSGPDDPEYGATVLVTRGGALSRTCQCGGLAYAGVFGSIGADQDFYQPALVFAGRDGRDTGEAVSHEAGHTFGLMHDGTASEPYYPGRQPWAPIMGSSYGMPVTQWSIGEYPGATNQQDDLAVIARGAPVRADDHGDTVGTATTVRPGTPVAGLITSRADVDAFTFTAAGAVRLTASPTSEVPDLDIGLRILDGAGSTVALLDPPVRRTRGAVSGLAATWSARLPRRPATYTAVVDGVGSGSPLAPGGYSDYASLGSYRVTLATR